MPLERAVWRFNESDTAMPMDRPNDNLNVLNQAIAPPKGKLDTALGYLRANPEAMMLSGRALAANVKPDDISISYRVWNTAKGMINDTN